MTALSFGTLPVQSRKFKEGRRAVRRVCIYGTVLRYYAGINRVADATNSWRIREVMQGSPKKADRKDSFVRLDFPWRSATELPVDYRTVVVKYSREG